MAARNEDTRKVAESFYQKNQTHHVIYKNGMAFLLFLYKAPNDNTDVDEYRYVSFVKTVARKEIKKYISKHVELKSLRPTWDAARYHFYRVYLQQQKWLSNDLPVDDWGWAKGNMLSPIRMTKPLAPKCLLDSIFCSCSKSSCKNANL